ncbi:MAG: hypothetical protein AAFR73_12355 [Pseudomonadota bacterium]
MNALAEIAQVPRHTKHMLIAAKGSGFEVITTSFTEGTRTSRSTRPYRASRGFAAWDGLVTDVRLERSSYVARKFGVTVEITPTAEALLPSEQRQLVRQLVAKNYAQEVAA